MGYNVKRRIGRHDFLKLLAEQIPIKEIAKKLKKGRPALYRMRERLVKDGLLNEDYSFSNNGFKLLEKDALLSQNVSRRNVIRLHNVAVVVKLAGKPSNWDSRRETWRSFRKGTVWSLKSGDFTEVKLLEGVRVRTTPSSVIIYFGEVWCDEPTEAKNRLFAMAYPAISLVEKELKVRLHRSGTWVFSTAQQEFAMVKNGLAVELCKAGFKVRVSDLEGRTRVVVDESLGFGELETPNAIRGEGDALALKGLFEDVAVFGLSMRELNSRLESLEHFTFKASNKPEGERREVG